MPRSRSPVASRQRRKRELKRAKGFRGRRKSCIRIAHDAVSHAGRHAYIGRKQKKRTFRALWITRITAAARAQGISYSRLMCGLREAQVDINRKMLSELAIHNKAAFSAIVEQARKTLNAA